MPTRRWYSQSFPEGLESAPVMLKCYCGMACRSAENPIQILMDAGLVKICRWFDPPQQPAITYADLYRSEIPFVLEHDAVVISLENWRRLVRSITD